MESAADLDGLSRLRHRFLLEEAERITEWLWDEHPQAAAFLLNWLGDPKLLGAYLKPLPPVQQADVLYRITSLEPGTTPSPLQEEILVASLRRLSPYLREAGSDLSHEDPDPVRGDELYLAHLGSLAAEDRRALIAAMEEVEPVLARFGASRTGGTEDGESARTFQGLANTFADWIGIALSRRRLGGALAFADTVEMVSGTGFTSDAPAMVIPFRAVHAQLDSGLYLLLSPTLLFHYLECAFGAPHPRFLHEASKAQFSDIESRLGLSLAGLLADGLGEVFGVNGGEEGYQIEPVEAALLRDELAGFGKTPFLSCQYTVKLGHAVAGRIGLLIPPSHLRALGTLTGRELFDNLLPETLPALPRRDTPGAGSRKRGRKGASSQPPGKVAAPEDEASLSLEDFLWRIELEEAERAETRPGGRPPQPIDLLLQGYDPDLIAKDGKRSLEENERAADLHYQYGARFFQISQYAEATEALERALAAKPGHEGAQVLMAAAWGEQGMYFREILAYKKMIAEGLALTEAQVLLARRLAFLGRADEAFQALSGAIQRGFQPKEIVEADACFKSLRRHVKWRQYLADQA